MPHALRRIVLLAVFGAIGSFAPSGVQAAAGGRDQPALPLFVTEAKTPRIGLPCVDTSGVYPRVSRVGVPLVAVNAAIRRAVLDDEHAFFDFRGCPPANVPHSIYETTPDPRWTSASSIVVSALIPKTTLYDAGNEGGSWLSVTVRVADSHRVTLTELFREPARGLRALAAMVRERLSAPTACDPQDARFALFVDKYKYFALTVRGLAIGFPQADGVAIPSCGRIEVTIPYVLVKPYLSTLGRELVAGVRRPATRP